MNINDRAQRALLELKARHDTTITDEVDRAISVYKFLEDQALAGHTQWRSTGPGEPVKFTLTPAQRRVSAQSHIPRTTERDEAAADVASTRTITPRRDDATLNAETGSARRPPAHVVYAARARVTASRKTGKPVPKWIRTLALHPTGRPRHD